MALITSFRDLEVYKLGREQAKRIFIITKSFPKEEKYSLTDQVRRSSRAVKAMVAEAWARPPYPSAFVYKLHEAIGEATETQSWLDAALDCEYIELKAFQEMNNAWQHVGPCSTA